MQKKSRQYVGRQSFISIHDFLTGNGIWRDLGYLGHVTPCQFILFDEDLQAEEVWQGGFMTFREEGGNTVLLYLVHSFYVEVFYDKQSNAITRLNPFRSKARLRLYLTTSLN